MEEKSFCTQLSEEFIIRVLFLVVVMIATASNVRSQNVASGLQEETLVPKYRWGVKGGLNSAYEYSDKGTTDARTGLHLGLFMESTLSPKVDIQTEFVYSMQGCVDKNNFTDKFDYINVPVIFKIYTNQSRTVSIDVGPQLGYMVSAKGVYSSGTTIDVYNNGKMNKIDGAVCFGVSYKFNPSFHIGLRYNYGVTKIIKGVDNRNAVGQLGVGYMF